MSAVLTGCGPRGIAVSQDEAQRLKFWSGRKNAFPASGRISPDYMCMDSTIPRKRLADILLAIRRDGKEVRPALRQRLPCRRRQPAPADPVRRNDPDQLHRCELFGADILETSVAMGGTVTGEHGVGIEKLSSMCVQFSPRSVSRCSASSAPSTAEPAEPRQGDPRCRRAAPSTARCTSGRLLPFPELHALLIASDTPVADHDPVRCAS